jgi:hypothetical protein
VTREPAGGWLVPTLPPPGTCACNHRAPGRRGQADPARRAACGPSTGSGAAAEPFQYAETATKSNEARVGTRGPQLARDAPAATCLRRRNARLPGIIYRRLQITADLGGFSPRFSALVAARNRIICVSRNRPVPDSKPEGHKPASGFMVICHTGRPTAIPTSARFRRLFPGICTLRRGDLAQLGQPESEVSQGAVSQVVPWAVGSGWTTRSIRFSAGLASGSARSLSKAARAWRLSAVRVGRTSPSAGLLVTGLAGRVSRARG